MPLTEEELNQLEAQIPELSRRAFREAFEQAMASGHPVTILEGNEIVQVTQDGQREVIARTDERLTLSFGVRPGKGQAWEGRVQ